MVFKVVPPSLTSTNTTTVFWVDVVSCILVSSLNFVGMGGRRSTSPDGAQALITDYFHQLRDEELSSEWVVYQTLITDFYHKWAESSTVFQSISQLSISDSEFDSLLRKDPQTLISQYNILYSECTHISETPEIRLARAQIDMES